MTSPLAFLVSLVITVNLGLFLWALLAASLAEPGDR